MTTTRHANKNSPDPSRMDPEPELVSLKDLKLGEYAEIPWYKRRNWVIIWGLAAIAAVAVITDYPRHATTSQAKADGVAFVTSVTGNVAPCVASLTNANKVYATLASGHANAQQISEAPRLLQDDLVGCSYADGSIFSIATISLPRTLVHTAVGPFSHSVATWAWPTADAVIKYEIDLSRNPHDAAARAGLARAQAKLNVLRAQAYARYNLVVHQIGISAPPLNLPMGNQQAP